MKNYALEIEGLSVNYDRKRVLANVYLQLEGKRIYGLLGPNGAGKSTLFKAILGLKKPSHGWVQIFGNHIDEVRKRVAYVPQNDDIDSSFPANVLDVVLMGRFPHKGILSSMTKEDKAIAKAALQKVDMWDYRKSKLGALSGGQQQRVLIARALAQQADLYLLDEPFVGIDATTERKVVEIMRQLAEQGSTLLVVHHDLSTVTDYFDEVILLNQHIIDYGKVRDVFTEENLSKCYSAQLPILHKTKI